MVKAQEWLDKNYPKEGRENIKKLDLANKELEGDLDLDGFDQYLKIDINKNPNLGKIKRDSNFITIKINAQEWLNWKYPNKEETKEIVVEKWEKPEYTLVVEDFPLLEILYPIRTHDSGLVKLKVDNCPKLTTLCCSGGWLVNEITVSNCPNLKDLSITSNHLDNLTLSSFPNLESFHCKARPIDFDFKNNRKLKNVFIRGVKNKKLDFSNLVELKRIDVSDNGLTELNIKNCPKLERAVCWENSLTALDLTGNVKLKLLDVRYSNILKKNITSLNLFEDSSSVCRMFVLKYLGEKQTLILRWEGVKLNENKDYCDNFTVIDGCDESNLLFSSKFFVGDYHLNDFQKGKIYKLTHWGKLEKDSSNFVQKITGVNFIIKEINDVQFIKKTWRKKNNLETLNQNLKDRITELETQLKTEQQKVEQITQILIPPKQ